MSYRIDGVPVSNFVYPAWFEYFSKTRNHAIRTMGNMFQQLITPGPGCYGNRI